MFINYDKLADKVVEKLSYKLHDNIMKETAIYVISLYNTEESFNMNVLDENSPYKTLAYVDVCTVVLREIELLKKIKLLRDIYEKED